MNLQLSQLLAACLRQPEWCQLVLAATGGVLEAVQIRHPAAKIKELLYFPVITQYIAVHAEGITLH